VGHDAGTVRRLLPGPARRDDGRACSFKADDVAFEMLTSEGVARPAPYLARAKWVSFAAVEDAPDDDLRAYLQEAHALIAAKLTRKARQALGLA
jgi:predicted DNA-binding protein (MmcQ/YjbR family)